jgi:hypothetical protein
VVRLHQKESLKREGITKMIDKESTKIGRIVDGKLCAKIAGNKNVFSESVEIPKLEEKIQHLRDALNSSRKSVILPTFRKVVTEFIKLYGEKPTMVLMNYADLGYLIESYNEDNSRLANGIPYVSRYDDNAKIVDGIKVKQGCDQKIGEIRIYQFES